VPRVTLESISNSRITDATIRRMYELVDAGKVDASFQKLIYDVVGKALPGHWKDYRQELDAVMEWFKSRHDYRRDPVDVELLQDVWATLERKRFDCDDGAIFLAAASEVLGNPARFVTVSTRLDKVPCHVYIQAHVNGDWMGLDSTAQKSTVGWEPPDVTDKRIWTRKDVGLQGLGDSDMNGNGKFFRKMGGFSTMYYPDDPNLHAEAKTFADPQAGEMGTGRAMEYPVVLRSSDPVQQDRVTGGDYATPWPIVDTPLPVERGFLYPSAGIPRDWDVAQPPEWDTDGSSLYPQPITEDPMYFSGLGDVAPGVVNAAATSALSNAVVGAAVNGEIPSTQAAIDAAIKTAADVYAASVAARQVQPSMAPIQVAAPSSSMSPWLIPAIAVGGLLVVGFIISRK
jgi:hypothetical protein